MMGICDDIQLNWSVWNPLCCCGNTKNVMDVWVKDEGITEPF